jgi:hypothetical protein
MERRPFRAEFTFAFEFFHRFSSVRPVS